MIIPRNIFLPYANYINVLTACLFTELELKGATAISNRSKKRLPFLSGTSCLMMLQVLQFLEFS